MTTDSDALEVDATNTQGNPPDTFIEDNDPMLAGLKEEEGAATAEGEGEGNGGNPAPQEDKPQTQQQPTANKADDEGAKAPPVMIPKARLDEVLSENARLKDALTYKDGIIHTQTSIIAGKGTPAPAEGEGKTTEAPKADDLNAKIATAEEGILALAQKYEDGEISLVEYEKGKIDLNRQIRELTTEQANSVVETAKSTATAVVNATQKQQQIENQAVEIQKAHPYVEEIDKLPPAIAKGIWDTITTEALTTLKAQGIDPKDGTVESRMALIKEKALLTDKYGPQFTGKQIASQTPAGKPPLSDTAKQRNDKLELAAQQPPAVSAMSYGADKSELTADQIENMSDDQLADIEAQNPGFLERITGLKK